LQLPVPGLSASPMDVAQQSPTCTLSAIVDPAPATEAIAAKARVPLYKSLDELFEKNRPDGVILATPNQLHLKHALKCMAAGVPQLLEKPITPTVREAATLVKEADKVGAKVLIGHHRAPSPIMARAKELIDEGRLGPLVAVMGSAVFFKPMSTSLMGHGAGSWRRADPA
jgi:predicted dehydrogenase